MPNTLSVFRAPFVAIVSLGILACSDASTDPPIVVDYGPGQASVAVTELDSGRPMLFLQSLLVAPRRRVRLTNVTDQIPGNYAGLVVDDAHLLALGSPTVAPTLDRVAVVATLAYDQSEIVVMNADGSRGEVASVNTQIIASSPEWSPDGRKLAYTMSTLPGFGGIDLFVTDLVAHRVTRLTTGANIANAAVRWSSDGRSVLYAHTTAATPGAGNLVSEIVRVDVATGAATTVARDIIGQVNAIAAAGTHALVVRNVGPGPAPVRTLVDVRFDGTPERTISASGVSSVRFTARSEDFVVVATAFPIGDAVSREFHLIRLDPKKDWPLTDIGENANVDIGFIPPEII